MTCRHCHEQIRLCDCGNEWAEAGWSSAHYPPRRFTAPHWVLDVADVRYPSRWCMPASLDRTHEPEETHHG